MPSVLIDTNVLIYAQDPTAVMKREICVGWLRTLINSNAAVISRQVLHELYVNLIYKARVKQSPERARSLVLGLEPLATAPMDGSTLTAAWTIQDLYGVHFWDALILASANAAGCAFLLSEDLNDQQVYGRVRVINPFRHSPVDVLGRAP